MKLAAGLFCLLLFAGCTSPRGSTQKIAHPASTPDELALARKANDSLGAVIRTLKPEAFTEVGLYRINPGDTVARIARKFGVRLEELDALNPDVNWTKLRVWQVIRVRAVEEPKAESGDRK